MVTLMERELGGGDCVCILDTSFNLVWFHIHDAIPFKTKMNASMTQTTIVTAMPFALIPLAVTSAPAAMDSQGMELHVLVSHYAVLTFSAYTRIYTLLYRPI